MKAATYIILLLAIVQNSLMAEVFLVVAEEYPPYEYKNNDKTVGMDIDVLKRAAQIADIKLRFKFYPWRRAMSMVKKGSADAIICLNKTKERQDFLYFPQVPLSLERMIIFKNNQSKDVAVIGDLHNRKVGIISGYSYAEKFEDAQLINKTELPDQEALLRQLANNRVEYALHNNVATVYLAKKLKLKNIMPTPLVVSESSLYIGVSRQSFQGESLYQAIDAALLKMQASGELDRIRKKYLN